MASHKKLEKPIELTDAEVAHVAGGDKPNASGFNGGGKKVAQLSQNPNDGPPPGAYDPGN
jgi:hypothetical protein